MKMRIVMEVETSISRKTLNDVAKSLSDRLADFNCQLIYLATEEVVEENRNIMIEKE